MTNEDKRFEQLRFERKFIVIPYLIYAVILFIAFIKHYKRTLLLSLILTVLSGAAFFGIIYVYGINHF
ncbi:TPA: hypothetical protein ACF9B6_000671 [Staphylococcus aureus]